MPPNLFGQRLAEYRDLAGLTQKQLAQKSHMAHSSINRWEKGGNLPKRDRVVVLDRLLAADGRLVGAWRAARGGTGLPEWARDLESIENAARTVSLVSPSLVPGMLQCEAYARTVFQAGQSLASADEVDRLVELRCGRLADLRALQVTAVFPASAVAGLSDSLRRDQAKHLKEWVDSGRVKLHLVPERAPLFAPTAPLMVYTLQEHEIVVASDHAAGTVILTDSNYRADVFTSAALGSALPPTLSYDLLESYL